MIEQSWPAVAFDCTEAHVLVTGGTSSIGESISNAYAAGHCTQHTFPAPSCTFNGSGTAFKCK